MQRSRTVTVTRTPRSGSGRCLFETSIIEAVRPRFAARQQLPPERSPVGTGSDRSWQPGLPGTGFRSQELGHDRLIFRGKDGAGAVEQAAEGGEHSEGGAQELELGCRKGGDVAGAPQELDVRMAPDDPRRAARRVDQNPLVGDPIPEAVGLANVAGYEPRGAPQT